MENHSSPSNNQPAAKDPTTFVAFRHIPELDGLRGIAVLLVIALHAHIPFFLNRSIGVDLFFVLSGFLITSIMLKEWQKTKTISLSLFYSRRVLRLYPGLFFMIVGVCLHAIIFLPWLKTQQTLITALLSFLFVGNWAEAYGLRDFGIFYHTWSLSIEFQYYLVWPFIVRTILRSGFTIRALIVMGIVAIVLIATRRFYCVSVLHLSSERVYLGLDTHSDGLILGGVIAMLYSQGWLLRKRIGSLLINFLFGCSLIYYFCIMTRIIPSDNLPLWLHMSLVVTCTSFVLVWVITAPPGRTAWLRWKPLVWIGTISYGLYLWNFPTTYILTIRALPESVNIVLQVTCTFVAAVTSYYLIEKPFLMLKDRMKPGTMTTNQPSPENVG